MNETAEFRKVMRRHNQLRFSICVLVPFSALWLFVFRASPEILSLSVPLGLFWLILITFFTPLFLNPKWGAARSVINTAKKTKKLARFLHTTFSDLRFKMTRVGLLLQANEANAGKPLVSTNDFVLFEKYLWLNGSSGWIKDARALHEPARYKTMKVGTSSTTKHTHINDETTYSETTSSPDYTTYKAKNDKVVVRGPFIKKAELEFLDAQSAQDFIMIFEDAVKNWRRLPEPVMDEADAAACKENLDSMQTIWQKMESEMRQPVLDLYNSSFKDVPLAVMKSALKPALDVDNSTVKPVLPFAPKPK